MNALFNLGKLNVERATECLRFLTSQLSSKSDLSTMITLLREIKSIVEVYQSLLPSFLPQISAQTESSTSSTIQTYLQQLNILNQQVIASSAITIVRVNCENPLNYTSSYGGMPSSVTHVHTNSIPTPTIKTITANLNDSIPSPSRSYGSYKLRDSNIHVFHRSIPRLHIVSGGHIIGRHSSSSNVVHRSMTALQMANSSSSRLKVNRMSVESVNATGATPSSSQKSASSSYLLALQEKELQSKTVATSVDSQLQQTNNATSSSSSSSHYNIKSLSRSEMQREHRSSYLNGENITRNNNRGSLFEPNYPVRDAVQHFCEKHIDKIKAFMQKIFVKIPLPVKCTIEERKAKKIAKLHFACQGKGEHCFYAKTYYVIKTRNARIWIHLMFLALQAKASAALCTRESSVFALKNCWDILKADNKDFLTLVTSSFPSAKDQDFLIQELRSNRYFDVFEFNAIASIWGCFLCNHPDKAPEFLQNNEPVIEGQLKEKKGKWKLFRRWRTRYFTLSGIHLSYREAVSEISYLVKSSILINYHHKIIYLINT